MDKHWTSTGHGLKASDRFYNWTKSGQILDIDISMDGIKPRIS